MKIDDDEIFVLIGPTGSGKTTILNLIAGLLKPDEGSILMDGIEITTVPVESRKIGYTFQDPSLFPHLNVYENIVFGLTKKSKKENHHQVKKLINDLGISYLANRSIQGLSGGEMQKVSLARMLVTKPNVMLMDEPLVHLDALTRRKLRVELRRVLQRQGIPTIYVTHFEDDVYALADSVSILQNGLIKNKGKLENILTNSNPSPFLSNFLSEGNYLEGNVVHSKDEVTTFKIGTHLLEVLGEYSIGSKVGIVVRPEDIILSREFVKTSARNVLKTKVTNVTTHSKSGIVDIQLFVDNFRITSRITEESRRDLGIKKDDYMFAIFKASSPQVVREEYSR